DRPAPSVATPLAAEAPALSTAAPMDAPRGTAAAPPGVPLADLGTALRQDVLRLQQEARAAGSLDRLATERSGGGARTEIELAPAELGKLRIVLQSSERGLHVQIAVERPETLDLVRRHVEGLHRNLLADGVSLSGLDIGTGTGTQAGKRDPGAADQHPQGPGLSATDDIAPAPPPPLRTTSSGRLDIRV
ncbi:MAG: flagellar hook-length control protein FliK, partial [Jannaschia sp.]